MCRAHSGLASACTEPGTLGGGCRTVFWSFLGRHDHQVKIRGYRVELGEVEAALADFPGLRQAVVLAREDTPGDKRLVGYVTPAGDIAPSPLELRGHLQRRLPDYMVPSAFVVLEELPLTANGKVDRAALPAPEGRPEVGLYVAPRTPTEQALISIWCEVLKPGAGRY